MLVVGTHKEPPMKKTARRRASREGDTAVVKRPVDR
jgi:hypothetical protein